jgi:hypothetical protein
LVEGGKRVFNEWQAAPHDPAFVFTAQSHAATTS